MKKLIISIIFVMIFFSYPAIAQDLFSKRCATINSFISAVFKDKKNTRFIMDNYMQVNNNDTVSTSKKETVVAAMINNFQVSSRALSSSAYEISIYDKFKGDKKKFNTNNYDDIIIVSIKDIPMAYFYFKQDRISSFYYIDKGSLSFFLTI